MESSLTIRQHEKMFQRVRIADYKLMKTLGGLYTVYRLPILTIAPDPTIYIPKFTLQDLTAPLIRAIGNNGLPFFVMIFLIRSNQQGAVFNKKFYQIVTIYQNYVSSACTWGQARVRSSQQVDIDVPLKDENKMSILRSGAELEYTPFESIRLITQEELDSLKASKCLEIAHERQVENIVLPKHSALVDTKSECAPQDVQKLKNKGSYCPCSIF